MKIWLITVGEPLPTETAQKRAFRTGLLARLLADRGHQVTWWTSSVNHFDKSLHAQGNDIVPIDDRLIVRFLHGRPYRRNISIARFVNHWQIGRIFASLARQAEQPDIILCSLPTIELSDAAVRYGLERRVPVLLDIRDLWPDEYVAKLPKPLQPIGRLLFAPLFGITRRATANATGLIAVSQTYLDWGLALAGRKAGSNDRVFYHGYPDTSEKHAAQQGDAERLSRLGVDPDRRVFWFIGNFVDAVDLSTVIAAARLLGHRSDIQFVLSGSGEHEQRYRAEAAGLNNVVFTGWIDRPEIATLARRAYVGLSAYRKGTLVSLTNKMSEYLAGSIPILTSLPGEPRRIVVDHDAGRGYNPGDPQSLASAVSAMADDPVRHDVMSANARRLFETHFSADHVYEDLAAFIIRLASRG